MSVPHRSRRTRSAAVIYESGMSRDLPRGAEWPADWRKLLGFHQQVNIFIHANDSGYGQEGTINSGLSELNQLYGIGTGKLMETIKGFRVNWSHEGQKYRKWGEMHRR